jgi:hypothetical protein
MPDDDDFVFDEDLLIEAARFAVLRRVQREQFISLAKKAWYQADAEWRAERYRARQHKSKARLY